MSSGITAKLLQTVVERWYRRLAASPSAQRSHWQTKTIYFRSVDHLVATVPAQPLTWKTIVEGAHPHGCRSTFYEVTGAHARHPMIDDLIRDGRSDSIQLALRYHRSDAVEQLLDETKIWSYWPYRERLLAKLAATPMTEHAMRDALTETLVTWARQNRPMAAAMDHTPPACAVEDLVVIAEGRIAAIRAERMLTDVVRTG